MRDGAKPLISVVIPTRNRPDTLAICLQAMRHHKSGRIEIVVQDNSTNPETLEVVKAATDPRIRYSQAPYPTSQRHNFELGLAAARGDYLSIIGDDDGYSIGSLDWLVDRLTETPVDAVRWNLLHYVWPSLSEDGEGFMDLYPSTCFGGHSIESAAALSARVLRAETQGSWDNLLVYHGMISRKVYDRMKAITGGVFFAYPMPDVYAHNIIPFFCDKYLQVNKIVSIYGTSGHSAGASWTRARTTDADASAAGNRWMAESVADEVAQRLPWQPDIRTLRYHDYATLKLAEDHGMLGGQTVDPKVWEDAIIAELSMNSTQLAPWMTAEPKADFDERFFSKVRKTFSHRTDAAPVTTSNKRAANDKLPSLRIRAVERAFPDDVEGAMLALSKVLERIDLRFDDNRKPTTSRTRELVKTAALRFRRQSPWLSSRLLNSRYMPQSVWRYLKTLQYSGDHHAYEAHKLVTKLNNDYADKETPIQ